MSELCRCGHETEKRVGVMYFSFGAKDPDEPYFDGPCCDDCRAAVAAEMHVRHADWVAQHAAERAAGMRAALDAGARDHE